MSTNKTEFIVTNIAIDIETDGLNEETGHILQIGACATDDNGYLLDTFKTYVQWSKDEVDFNCEAIVGRPDKDGETPYHGNGCTYAVTCRAPSLVAALIAFDEWMRAIALKEPELQDGQTKYECITNLIFQNAPFDVGWLKRAYRYVESQGWCNLTKDPFRRVIELSTLSKFMLEQAKPVSLEKAGYRAGVPNTNKHDALADAIQTSTTYHIYKRRFEDMSGWWHATNPHGDLGERKQWRANLSAEELLAPATGLSPIDRRRATNLGHV